MRCSGFCGSRPCRRCRRSDHLRQAAGMEDLAVQVMSVAVVAQVQAHHIKAEIKELLGEREDIDGVAVALPAVQQHRDALDAARCRHAQDRSESTAGARPSPQSSRISWLAARNGAVRGSTQRRRAGRLGRIDCRWRLRSQRGGPKVFVDGQRYGRGDQVPLAQTDLDAVIRASRAIPLPRREVWERSADRVPWLPLDRPR